MREDSNHMVGIAPADVPVLRSTPTMDPATAERRLRALALDWIRDRHGDDRDPSRDYFAWRDDVRITHTRFCNTAAWAAHGREDPIYLDAAFGALLYHEGRHAMTIGFAPSRYGILVAQVQLRQRRGNRFLYRLPMPHLDFALDLLQRAFLNDPLHLVTGASTTTAIRRACGKNSNKLAPDAAALVERFYDQPLCDYVRTGETVQCDSEDGRVFARLALSSRGRRAA